MYGSEEDGLRGDGDEMARPLLYDNLPIDSSSSD
jgi:hypothetical protein